jgi:two-component system, cell cycle sensor histidine kinase and response regulator CckA
MDIDNSRSAAAKLRRRAETELSAAPVEAALPVTGDTMSRLFHELQVQQIELEMQNSELNRMRDTAERSLERYADLYDFAPVGYVTLDRTGAVLAANLTAADLLAVRRARLPGRPFGLFVAAKDRKAFSAFLDSVFICQGQEACELTLLSQDNQSRIVQIEARAADSGQECRIALIDMTERRRSENAARESEEQVYSLAEMAVDAIIMLDEVGTVTFCNGAAQRMFGQAGTPVTGQAFQRLLIPAPVLAATELSFARFRERGSGPLTDTVTEVAALREDGSPLLLELSISVRMLLGRCHAIGILRDITERKRQEAQQVQQQKMEAVGLLAGGIAHDINNILCVIGGYGTLAEMNLQQDDPLGEHLRQIIAAANRGSRLTRSLLDFSRVQPVSRQPVQVQETVKSLDTFLQKMLGDAITLKSVCPEAPLTVALGSGQFEQVLTNLASNAGHAMPEGGTLTITAETVEIDAAFIKAHGFGAPGPFALLSVTDSGTGMDKETVTRIFEPFFTTRPPGAGTGLGLSLVYNILRQHDGFIEVLSEPGRGTAFLVYLPLFQADTGLPDRASLAAVEGGTETILLAEDDEAVRLLTSKVLAKFGYRVITARDGEDAIGKFRAHKDAIHLLLLDVIMPGRNGKDTFNEISKIRPGTRGLFMTSYNSEMLDGISFEAGTDIIRKPFAPLVLKRRVREMLDKGKPPCRV